ncbi:right-handed parallel beta-helix repeat-containing protein [candidate division KSB1 bacterium]
MKLTRIFRLTFVVILLSSYPLYGQGYSVSIKLNFVANFSTSFQQNQPWEDVDEQDVKDFILQRIEDDFDSWGISVSTSSGNVTANIGVNGTGFGSASVGTYTTGTAQASIYSNNFADYSQWQGVENATVERIGEAIAGTVSHEIGHILNLYHAYMFDSFDPTIEEALNDHYYPFEPYYLPDEAKTDTCQYNHLMATSNLYITLDQRATINRFFGYNSTKIITFALNGGGTLSCNIAWGIANRTWEQKTNIIVPEDYTFILASGDYTHELVNYSISGTDMLIYGTLSPKVKRKLTSTGVTKEYHPSLEDALSSGESGCTIEVYTSLEEQNSATVSSQDKLDIKPGVTIEFDNGEQLTVQGEIVANDATFCGVSSPGGYDDWWGIWLDSDATASIQNCTIKNASTGICAYLDSDATIEENNISRCYYGVACYMADPNRSISGNILSDISKYGIMFWYSYGTITDNTISNCSERSMEFKGTPNPGTITGNTINGGGSVGISISNYSDPYISDNQRIDNCSYALVRDCILRTLNKA